MHPTLTRRYSNNAKCSVFTVSFDNAGYSNLDDGQICLTTLNISSKYTALNSVSVNNDVERKWTDAVVTQSVVQAG